MTTAEKQYDLAKLELDRLSDERQDPSFWMANIVDATKGMTDNISWQNFYNLLSNDRHVFQNKLEKTLGECIDEGEKLPHSEIEFAITEVQNGDVTHMKVVPILNSIDKNKHESVAQLPEIVPR